MKCPEKRLDPEQPVLAVIAKMVAWHALLEKSYDRSAQYLLTDQRYVDAVVEARRPLEGKSDRKFDRVSSRYP